MENSLTISNASLVRSSSFDDVYRCNASIGESDASIVFCATANYNGMMSEAYLSSSGLVIVVKQNDRELHFALQIPYDLQTENKQARVTVEDLNINLMDISSVSEETSSALFRTIFDVYEKHKSDAVSSFVSVKTDNQVSLIEIDDLAEVFLTAGTIPPMLVDMAILENQDKK